MKNAQRRFPSTASSVCWVTQPNLTALSHSLIEHFIKLAMQTVANKGSFHVGLSGGQTPRLFYHLLTKTPYCQQLPWEAMHIYLVDERFVPSKHAQHNGRMIEETLIRHIPLPNTHWHAIATDDRLPTHAANEYAKILCHYLPCSAAGHLYLDYVLLGLGEDGHFASLFPKSSLLTADAQLVTAGFVPSLSAWRISMTLPLLNHANHIAFLVAGQSKGQVISHCLSHDPHLLYPIQSYQPIGQVTWFLDQAANDARLSCL